MSKITRLWVKEGKKQIKTVRITMVSDRQGLQVAHVEPTKHFKVRR